MKQHNRVCAEIDLDAIAYNMEQMRKRIGGDAKLIAVVKTDGYGHGAVPIAEMFEEFFLCMGVCSGMSGRSSGASRTWDKETGTRARMRIPGSVRRYALL